MKLNDKAMQDVFEQYPIEWYRSRLDIPLNINGAYLLFDADELDYIGESDCIQRRLGSPTHPAYDASKHHIAVIRLDMSRRGRQGFEGKLRSTLKSRLNYTNAIMSTYTPEQEQCIEQWMTKRRGSTGYQVNILIPEDQAQALADALEALKRANLTASKSALIVEAVIEHARQKEQR